MGGRRGVFFSTAADECVFIFSISLKYENTGANPFCTKRFHSPAATSPRLCALRRKRKGFYFLWRVSERFSRNIMSPLPTLVVFAQKDTNKIENLNRYDKRMRCGGVADMARNGCGRRPPWTELMNSYK